MKKFKEYTERAFSLLGQQNPLYKSSSFWEKACKEITEQTIKKGLNNFREDQTNLSFFVPTYGYPGNSFSKEKIQEILNFLEQDNLKKPFLGQKQFLSGYDQALSDYRVLLASNKKTDKLDLLSFSESTFGNPIEHFEIEEKVFSRSSMNYLLGLSYLKSLLPSFVPQSVLEIGGGFGSLGEILNKTHTQDFKYIDVDLPPMFSIAHEYMRNACNLSEKELYISDLDQTPKKLDIAELPMFSFLPSWEMENLTGKIDLFVNFISFQEMEPPIVRNYLKRVSDLEAEVILLRNMREGKQKATKSRVGVITPVLGEDFKKLLSNYKLIGKNVMPYGYATVDKFHSELYVFTRK